MKVAPPPPFVPLSHVRSISFVCLSFFLAHTSASNTSSYVRTYEKWVGEGRTRRGVRTTLSLVLLSRKLLRHREETKLFQGFFILFYLVKGSARVSLALFCFCARVGARARAPPRVRGELCFFVYACAYNQLFISADATFLITPLRTVSALHIYGGQKKTVLDSRGWD